MAPRSSFLDRFRVGSGRALLGFAEGPLAFGQRQGALVAGKSKGWRKAKPDELQKRLIIAGQMGQLPDVLVRHLPPLATQHEFTALEAATIAGELGVTTYHLVAEGVLVEGHSSDDLMAFLAEYASAEPGGAGDSEVEVPLAPQLRRSKDQKQPSTSGKRPPPAISQDPIDAILNEVLSAGATEGRSPFFDISTRPRKP